MAAGEKFCSECGAPVVAQGAAARPTKAAMAELSAVPTAPPLADEPSPEDPLSAFLAEANLSHKESELRALGCAIVLDLPDLDESDYEDVGMKKMEIKRLKRNV